MHVSGSHKISHLYKKFDLSYLHHLKAESISINSLKIEAQMTKLWYFESSNFFRNPFIGLDKNAIISK